jgi:hypothetical protein
VNFGAERTEFVERAEETTLQTLSAGVRDDLVVSVVPVLTGRQTEVCPPFVLPPPLFFVRIAKHGG